MNFASTRKPRPRAEFLYTAREFIYVAISIFVTTKQQE